MPESGLERWRWVNDTNKFVSVDVDDDLVGNPNPERCVAFDARPGAKFMVYERYGAEIGGGYARSELPILYGRVADFCQRI